MAFEKGRGVLQLGENGFEESVVGMRGGGERARLLQVSQVQDSIKRPVETRALSPGGVLSATEVQDA